MYVRTFMMSVTGHKLVTSILTNLNKCEFIMYWLSFDSQSILPDAIAGVVHNVPALDTTWIETMSKKAALKLEKLDTDLKNYKSNSIKESIR